MDRTSVGSESTWAGWFDAIAILQIENLANAVRRAVKP